MYDIVCQTVGILAMAFSVLTFQFKDYKKLIIFQIMAAALFGIHYFMLGSNNGAISNGISIVRNVFFIFLMGKNKPKIIVASVFACLMVGFNLTLWEGLGTILICLGMTANTVSISLNNTQHVRIAIMIACPLMFAYNLINFSIGGLINETLVFISSIIGLIRHKENKTLIKQ